MRYSTSRRGKYLTSERKTPEHTFKQQESYQLIKMQGLLKLLLVCGILLAVAADTQALAVSHAENWDNVFFNKEHIYKS